jgi:maleylacetoacetate isomerase
MNQILLYDYARSSACYRVRIALNLKNVAYVAVPINLLDGAQKSPDYLALNRQGLLPMLSIDGHDLTQSLAIIDYLDAQYPDPPMVSSDPASRAKTLAQALLIAADIHPVNNLRILKYLKDKLGQDQAAVDDWYRHWIIEGFAALEALAPAQGLFGGDAPNLADVCLVPQMANARRFDTPMAAFPKLARIDHDLRGIAAFAKAAPDTMPANGSR